MPLTRTSKKKIQEVAKQWLSQKAGIFREDSDDELGDDDHPWEWIYASADANAGDSDTMPALGSKKNGRQSSPNAQASKSKMVGARMGNFECRLGDTVLLKSPEAGKAWAGIIVEFLEEEGQEEEDEKSGELVKRDATSRTKAANIMWFTSPDEFILTKRKKRTDALPNEQYITLDFNVNPLAAINGKARVLSKDAFFDMYPNGVPPKQKAALAEFNKCIVCRRGVNQLQGKYTNEFLWEDVYDYTEAGAFKLVEFITASLKTSRKRKAAGDEAEICGEAKVPSTPRKRQKTASIAGTPQSKQRRKVLSTPTHKRIIVKKPLEFTPLGTRILSPSHLTASPYMQARSLLHVSTIPASLPCRDSEFATVYESLRAAITDGTGTCIYISGPPGTGKTATVRDVIAHLNAAVLVEELDDFIFVEINGMKVTDPHQSYSLLWEALKGDRVSPSHALDLLQREFSHPSPRRIPCVVLMDELDQLVTRNQSVMYNFFNWPALRHSHLIVLAVANTMDLPERTLSNKISSRLGLTRITFSGYKYQELMEIIGSRLVNIPGNIVEPDAVQFASRKVAAVSGDARRALDICRRAVEIAEQANRGAIKSNSSKTFDHQGDDSDSDSSLPPTPSRRASGLKQAAKDKKKSISLGKKHLKDAKTPLPEQNSSSKEGLPRVTIATIKQAIQEATSTPLQQSLRCLPLSGKVFLAGLLARVRRTGITESTLGDVLDEAKRIVDAAIAVTGGPFAVTAAALRDFLLTNKLGGKSSGVGGPRISAMFHAAVELMNSGILALEGESGHISVSSVGGVRNGPGKGNRSGKIRLRIAAEDVKAAFRDDAEAKILGLGLDL